jgi:hypothetical protein
MSEHVIFARSRNVPVDFCREAGSLSDVTVLLPQKFPVQFYDQIVADLWKI